MVDSQIAYPRSLIFENIFRLMVIALAAAVGWTFNAVTDHEVRIVKIESNRFTAQDGRALTKGIEERIRAVEIEMATTKARLNEIYEVLRRIEAKLDK